MTPKWFLFLIVGTLCEVTRTKTQEIISKKAYGFNIAVEVCKMITLKKIRFCFCLKSRLFVHRHGLTRWFWEKNATTAYRSTIKQQQSSIIHLVAGLNILSVSHLILVNCILDNSENIHFCVCMSSNTTQSFFWILCSV